MVDIIFGGKRYTPVMQEFYDRITAAKEENERVRFVAVENFRLWCQVNKGTTTWEEGLRACTPRELLDQYYLCGGHVSSMMSNLLSVLVARLEEREAQREAELAAVAVTPILPPDDDEEVQADGAGDN